jgi:hypothetical protein
MLLGSRTMRIRRGPVPNLVPPARTIATALRELFVTLAVKSPIFPGETIQFSWSAVTITVSPLNLGRVSYALYLVDAFGNIDYGSLLASGSLSAADSGQVTPNNYRSPTYGPQLPAALAQTLYRLGTYTLRLVISGSGSDGPFESQDVLLSVIPPRVDASWWRWTVPQTQNVGWKDTYHVQGTFANKSTTVGITCNATVLESNLTDGDGTSPEVASDVVTAGPLQAVPVPFASTTFRKDWSWFIWGIMTPNGTPTDRVFDYQVRLDLTDQYGNGYPPGLSDFVFVDVRVSDTKWAALSTATGLMAGAAVTLAVAAGLACTPAGPILGAVGAGLAAAANALGAAANDPPTPDPLYRQPVALAVIRYPKDSDLAPLLAVLTEVSGVIARLEALNTIASRVVGAMLHKDVAAEKAQRQHARELKDELRTLGKRISRLTPVALKFFVGHKTLTSENVRKGLLLWRRDMPTRANIQHYFVDAGGSLEAYQVLQNAIEDPDMMDVVCRPAAVMGWIGLWAGRLAKAVAMDDTVEAAISEGVSPRSPRRKTSSRSARNG